MTALAQTFPPVVERKPITRAASDASYAAALKAEREAAQARYTRDYGHPSALYSEKGPFK